jgi:hypothetical protein
MSQEFETSDLSNLLPSNGTGEKNENTQSVSGVIFGEQRKPSFRTVKKTGALTEMVIKYSRGKIENEKQANIVLLASVIIIFAITIFVGTRGGTTKTIVPDSVMQASIEKMKNIPIPTTK